MYIKSNEFDPEKRFSASSYPSSDELDSPGWHPTDCLKLSSTGKRPPLKTFAEVQALLQQTKKREAKLLIRENSWPINSGVRSQLWPALCRQHQHGKSMLDGFYWDMVNQVRHNSNINSKPV
jgi:TBC1 domain family member 24